MLTGLAELPGSTSATSASPKSVTTINRLRIETGETVLVSAELLKRAAGAPREIGLAQAELPATRADDGADVLVDAIGHVGTGSCTNSM